MQFLRGSRFRGPTGYAFCDGAVEGYGSLNPVPAGYTLDRSGRLWSAGHGYGQPSDYRLTEDGELVEDAALAEKAGARPAAPIHSRRRP